MKQWTFPKLRYVFHCLVEPLFSLLIHKHSNNLLFYLQPATVSRCGMIYLEPLQLGWEPLVKSWLNTLPEALKTKEYLALLEDLFQWLIRPALRFLRKQCKVQFCCSLDFCTGCFLIVHFLVLILSQLHCMSMSKNKNK